MKVLVTGTTGQLGRALLAGAPTGLELLPLGRDRLDLADPQACHEAVLEHRPDWVLNAGAYTAVDRAEEEPDLADAVNAGAPGAFASALASTGGRLLQVSTDFVFNGRQGHPYRPDQVPDPIGSYGRSKARGERRLQEHLPPERSTILRTSWVYGPIGKNFCLTMLRLHRSKAQAGESLGVVADQVGCPTATHTLARACWAVINRQVNGIHHWSDAGAASWYDFAVAIGELGMRLGLLEAAAQVRPLTTADYPTPAERPSYSLLNCSSSRKALDLEPCHWQTALGEVLQEIAMTPA